MSVQIRCSNCDRICEPTDRYCPNCHEPLVKVELDEDLPIEGINQEFWRGFINKNADKYLNVYEKGTNRNRIRNFHLPAFFITTEWLMYRKMYWQALVSWLVSMLFVMGTALLCRAVSYESIFSVLVFSMITFLAGRAVFAFFAYDVYKNHCLRHLRKNPGLAINGGTNLIGAILCYVISMVISDFILEPIMTILIFIR